MSSSQTSAVVGEIVRLENLRSDALTTVDEAILRSLLSDDLIYIHGSGKIDTKESLLVSVLARISRYHKIVCEDVEVRVHGDTALVHGTMHIDRGPDDDITTLDLRFTNVWMRNSSGWQNIHTHSSKI